MSLQTPAHINHPLSHSRNIWSVPPPPPGQPLPLPQAALCRPVPTEGGTQGALLPTPWRLVNCGVGSVKIRPVCGPGSPRAQSRFQILAGRLLRASTSPPRSLRLPRPVAAAGGSPLDRGAFPSSACLGACTPAAPFGASPEFCPTQALIWRSWCWETRRDLTGRKEATPMPGRGQGGRGRGGGTWPSPGAAQNPRLI